MSLAKQRSKRGLNVLGTLPGKLIEQGRYNDAVGLEHTFNEEIKTFEIPVTILFVQFDPSRPRRSSFRIS